MTVSVKEDPLALRLVVDYFALESRQLVVIKLDIAVGHAAYLYFLTSVELVYFICLWAVYKFKLDLLVVPVLVSELRTVVAVRSVRCRCLVKINDHVRVTKRNNKPVLER